MHDGKKLLVFLVPVLLVIIAFSSPAAAVDEQSTGLLVIGDTPGETVTIPQGTRRYHNGSIVIKNDGALIVDGGELHLQGKDTHVFVNGNGRLIFRNGAHFHYEQTYVAQHILYGSGDGSIEFDHATVDCDGSTESVKLFERASYRAVETRFSDWTTWYLHNETHLTLIDVYNAGDIVFYDSPTIYAENVLHLMPWLHFGQGASVDLSFPDPSITQPVSKRIDNTQPGVSGIPWSLNVVNCRNVLWGLNPYPGSEVTVRDTNLTMSMMRYLGSGSYAADGLYQNRSHYEDQIFPVPDRYLRLVNTSVKWWKVEAEEQARLFANDLVFSEMMVKDDARVLVTNSTCECQTIHLGTQDRSYVYFKDGEVYSYVSAWQTSTLVLDGSIVDYTKEAPGKYLYQTRNIAHNKARLYCLNSYLLSPPEAVDSALAMVARIDTPATARTGQLIPIPGAAWITRGPLSPVRFESYVLSYQREGQQNWIPITTSSVPVVYPNNTLATWNARYLPAGSYTLRLTVFVNGDDPLTSHKTHYFPAKKKIVLLP